MGVSRNRKKHASKVAEYKHKVQGEKKRAQEALMKMYQEQAEAKNKMREHVSGIDVENTDIDVEGLDINEGIDVENFQLTEENAEEIVAEIIEDITEEKK